MLKKKNTAGKIAGFLLNLVISGSFPNLTIRKILYVVLSRGSAGTAPGAASLNQSTSYLKLYKYISGLREEELKSYGIWFSHNNMLPQDLLKIIKCILLKRDRGVVGS